ncbi:sensor histidine kinase [Sulfurospirillum multivorans]|uniref:histidine kinase n=2 Tax=Sulfurospirillum multivorans TaxID=66821 RepID=A0AA86E235_SULMK|nr:ATP-binding protein [Sulfurospirillum multivorans]AHJ12402.1 histidine kinase [Sulfurospirillum multivorans DSM 12446]QEH05900.1 histidine kinase [Sulfurospirillum multivorans]
MVQNTLARLVKKEYLRSIIFPLLLIEMMLLVAYFWSNAYVNATTKTALIEESKVHIKELSKRSATIVNNEFKTLSSLTRLFQKEHEHFFSTFNPLHVNTTDSTYVQTNSGVLFNTQKNEESCSLFFSNAQKQSPNRLEKAIATEKLDPFYTAILQSNTNIAQVYFNSYDSMNRLCPFMPNALGQYAHDIAIPTFNFYYLADAAHNPDKNVVWTDAYLDPAGAGWMISAIAPVYKGDFLEGVVGIDVTIEHLIKTMLSLQLPYRSMSMLVDERGNILAMSEALEAHLGIKELKTHTYDAPIEATITKPRDFNLFTNTTNPLAMALSRMIQENRAILELQHTQGDFIITQNTIAQTRWKFVLLLDKDSLLKNSTQLKAKTNVIGYLALGFMGLFYLIFLGILLARAKTFSNHILNPLQELIEATKTFKDKLTVTQIERSNIVEINTLLDNFTAMSQELQELYDSMDKKIKEGVVEHMETQKMMLYQSRLAQMGEMISMIAHQWRQPLGSISAVTASIKLKQSLKKFDLKCEQGRADQEEFLLGAIGKIETYIQFLTTTIDDFKNFFRPEQQQEQSSLQRIIDRALGLIGKSLSVHQITLHVNNTSSNSLITYETQMMQVLINILKNAQDAILEKKLENGTIWINAYEDNAFFVIEIEDNAGGIPDAILPKIFDPYFSTKAERNGTGLGLYMSQTIVQEHCHGSLHVENKAHGAKFMIKIRGEHRAN